jgi:AcrR family transcriptional regulator
LQAACIMACIMQSRKSKSINRREEILEKAAKLFRKTGYAATTMRMIATATGMEAASLYNHISSKQELLEELLFSVAEEFTGGMDRAEKLNASPLQKLEFLVDLHIDLTLRWPDRIALVTGDWVHLEEPRLSEYTALRTDYEQRFRKLIQVGKDQGILQQINSDLSLFSILSSLHWMYSWLGRHPEIETSLIRKELKQCLLGGLHKTENTK